MRIVTISLTVALLLLTMFGCAKKQAEKEAEKTSEHQVEKIEPVVVTDTVWHDTDDPAIWINPDDHAKSMVIGTDKDADGGLVAFDLDGKIIEERTVRDLRYPNNVDIEYGLPYGDESIDIAVVTERMERRIRVFRLPEMTPMDSGGIAVFEGEADSLRRVMGISLYKRPSDGEIFAIVSRKLGPSGSYLWQYRLYTDNAGYVRAEKVREFANFSGVEEIEALCVDDEAGYVYCSDEETCVRQYHADPDHPEADVEIATFATDGFGKDREGIAIYTTGQDSGFIVVSNQEDNHIRIYKREGEHEFVKTVPVKADDTDGIEITKVALTPDYPEGLAVVMSTDKTFHFYSWADLIGDNSQAAKANQSQE